MIKVLVEEQGKTVDIRARLIAFSTKTGNEYYRVFINGHEQDSGVTLKRHNLMPKVLVAMDMLKQYPTLLGGKTGKLKKDGQNGFTRCASH